MFLSVAPRNVRLKSRYRLKPDDTRVELVKQLVKETGITEAEAVDLVALLGWNWSSLVREARILMRKR